MGESHGVGTGAAGFGGAAGFAAGGAGAAATDCAGVAGTAGFAAAGFGSPSGGELGDLMSSGIFVQAQSYGSVCIEKNVNFYQLEKAKSTRGVLAGGRKFPSPQVILERSDCLAKRNNHEVEESLRFVTICPE